MNSSEEFSFAQKFTIYLNVNILSLADCELLCIYKEDFDEVLKEMMKTRHEDIKTAIRRFEYFNNFTDEKVFIIKLKLC